MQVENLKIGNTSYGITDANTLPALTAAQRTQLLLNGTYLSTDALNDTLFETADGTFEKFTKTTSSVSMTTSYATVTQNNYKLAAYGKGVYVVIVTSSNVAMYSTNGATWTTTTMPSSASWQSVTYGNGKFVAIAGGGSSQTNKAAYSTDGITWTASTLPDTTYWNSVVYGGDKFVAVAIGSTKGAYSSDGITWTRVTIPFAATDITHGNNKFVLIQSQKGTSTAYSSDGITWTTSTLPFSAGWNSVAYGNGLFVAINSTSGSRNKYATSADGITWTERTTLTNRTWQKIVFGDGIFISFASSTSSFAYSIDGLTWQEASFPSSASVYGATYGNEKFIVPAYNNDRIYTITPTPTYTYSLTPLSYSKSETDTLLTNYMPAEAVQTLPEEPVEGKVYFVTGA